ncbi:MAG: T9SS type A sorting domain-containing protein, partial [Opitutaceae bacterium]|nr:T9SS type A sorting domain-containing protein [Cytophagales bacterium]
LIWEVEEVGNTIKKGVFIIDASAATQIINLNEKITYNGAPYQFLSCKDYKITLSTGCNNSDGAIEWISSTIQTIGIYQEVKAGPDQEACDYSGSLQMTGFTPVSLAGDSSLDAWSGPDGVTINNDGLVTLGSYPSAMKNVPQTFTYKYKDKWGCFKTSDKKVTVFSRPSTPSTLTSNSPVCEGQQLVLTTSNLTGATYKWTMANAQAAESTTNNISLLAATGMNGIVKAIVIKNGCSSLEKTALVTINPLPVITIAEPIKNLCIWGSQIYYPQATVSPVNGTGVWSGYNIKYNSGNQKYYFDPFGLPANDYTITYNYIAPSTGCQKSANQVLKVGPQIITLPTQNVCQNSPSFPLIATPAGGTWYEYDLETVVTDINPSTLSLGQHQYWYLYTDANSCYSRTLKTITVNPTPVSTLSLTNPAGLRYKYYENILSTPWTAMPDFGKLTTLKEGTAGLADLGNRLRDTQYGFVYEGFVNIPASGNYTFYLSNIDGAKLYLDSTLLVNNDGIHATLFSSSQTKTLTAGTHPFRLEYFNTTGTGQLKLEWSGPGIGRQVLSGSFLSSPYTFCQGTSVSISGSDNSVPSVSYLWSNGATSKTILVSEDGNYNVRVTNADGCSSVSNSVSFRKLPLPDATILRAGGLSYSYYQNEGANYTAMPDFTNLVPVKTGYALSIDASLKNRDNKTAFVFEGYIMVDSYGDYTFYTSSDKHSRLYIDGTLVVDNTTPSVEKSGIVSLRPGSHKVKATYYNTTTIAQLSVSYQGPGITKKIIPSSVLYHDLTICESNSNIIAAKYASSYFWPVTQSTGYAVSAAPGTYNLTVTGANGCTANGSKTVYPSTLPSVSIATNAPNGVCSDSAFLIADPQVGQAPFSYQWSKNGTDITNATSQTLTAKTDGNYGIRISDACFKTSANTYYNIKFITTPSIVLGTDIVGVKSVCQTGGSANILVDIYNYSASKSYKVSLTGAGTLQKVVAANPVLSLTDAFNPGTLNYRWRMVNKNSSVASNSLINTSGQLSLTGTNPAITSTVNSMVALSRLDLRGDLDLNVKVISFTNSNTSAKAGLFVSNDIDNQAKGGYCIVSACKDGKIYFQYDANGDGSLEGSYSTPATVNQTNLWLRLKEQSKVFSAYYSTSSSTGPWVQIGSNVTISSSFISSNSGLFVSGGSATTACTGLFDDFKATSGIPLIELPITIAGDYTVNVTDNAIENSCSIPKTITIGSKPNPSVSLTLPQTGTCYNSNALLLSGGNPSGGTFSGTGVTKTGNNYYFTPTIALLRNNTISYTYTSVNECSSSSTGRINVSNVLPSIDLGFDHIIEKNKPDTLNALNTKADGSVRWSTGSTGLQLIYTPITTTYISASFTNSCGTVSDTVILIDPCTFTDYKRTLNGEKRGGGNFSGIYVLKGLTLNGGNYTFNPGTVLLTQSNAVSGIQVGLLDSTQTSLKLNGVTIRPACDSMWNGIRVEKGHSLKINENLNFPRSEINKAVEAIRSFEATIIVNNTDFIDNYIGITQTGELDQLTKKMGPVIVKNSTFDSNPSRLRGRFKNNYSERHINCMFGDFSDTKIESCTFSNSRIGLYALQTPKPPIVKKSIFKNCHQYAIYTYSLSTELYPFDSNSVTVPSQKVTAANVNPDDVAIGVSDDNGWLNYHGNSFKCNEPTNSQSKHTIGLFVWRNGSLPSNITPKFVNNKFDQIEIGVERWFNEPSIFTLNKFNNCDTAIDGFKLYDNSQYTYLNCNTFTGNKLNFDPGKGSYLVQFSDCSMQRLDRGDVFLSANKDSLTDIYNSEDRDFVNRVMALPAGDRKTLLKNFNKDSVSNQKETLNAKLVYLDLLVNPPITKIEGTKLIYNRTDSLRIQKLAMSNTEYSFAACRLLRINYPYAPCNEFPLIVPESLTERSSKYFLGQNIPNPANKETIIPVILPKEYKNADLEFRDITSGKLLLTIPVKDQRNVHVDISGFASGVYFYSLVIDGKKVATKKISIVK